MFGGQEKDVDKIKKSLIDGYGNSFWSCSNSKLGYSGTAIISRVGSFTDAFNEVECVIIKNDHELFFPFSFSITCSYEITSHKLECHKMCFSSSHCLTLN